MNTAKTRRLTKNQPITGDLFIKCLEGLNISYDMSIRLESAIRKRKETITQYQVAKKTGKGIATIRRFESGNVDSLFLYAFYLDQFS